MLKSVHSVSTDKANVLPCNFGSVSLPLVEATTSKSDEDSIA